MHVRGFHARKEIRRCRAATQATLVFLEPATEINLTCLAFLPGIETP